MSPLLGLLTPSLLSLVQNTRLLVTDVRILTHITRQMLKVFHRNQLAFQEPELQLSFEETPDCKNIL